MKKELENKNYDVIDYPRNIDDSVEVEYKQGQLDEIISSSKLYKEFKEDEDRKFSR